MRDQNETKRYYVVFKGRVQGVGFRWTAQNLAQNLGLSGWVRNLLNGDVDCEVQGSPKNVAEFLRKLHSQDRWIRIEDYSCKEIPLQEDTGRFIPRN